MTEDKRFSGVAELERQNATVEKKDSTAKIDGQAVDEKVNGKSMYNESIASPTPKLSLPAKDIGPPVRIKITGQKKDTSVHIHATKDGVRAKIVIPRRKQKNSAKPKNERID